MSQTLGLRTESFTISQMVQFLALYLELLIGIVEGNSWITHTAVHIVGGSARSLLGPHVWQAGSNKGERYARIDLTHYQRLSREDLDNIEDHANDIISANPTVDKLVLDRADADARFGFELYQGGPPKHSEIRIIRIGEHDVQSMWGHAS